MKFARTMMIRLLALILLVASSAVSAQDKSPDEAYDERIEQARALYRVAIAKRIRRSKIVEVVLLSFDDLREADLLEDDEDRFSVAPYEATTRVISEKTLTSLESNDLLRELANQIEKPENEGGAFCHFPIHGVRVYSDKPSGKPFDSKLVYSSSFCWVCGNFGFAYPDGAEWLDTNEKLKAIFSKLLPVPKEERERFEKKYPTKPTGEQNDARETSAQSVAKPKSSPRSP